MKKFLNIFVIVAFLLTAVPVLAAETGHARVIKTGTLRCGFTFWDGGVMRDEKTNELKGFIVDLTNELAKVGDVKIEWVGPIDWGQNRRHVRRHVAGRAKKQTYIVLRALCLSRYGSFRAGR